MLSISFSSIRERIFSGDKMDSCSIFCITIEICLSFLLTRLDAQKPVSSDRLLGLLGANRKLQPAFFSYIEERKQIELSSSFPNGQVGPKMLREMLQNLSNVAEETANLWDLDGKSAPNLVGKWSAARSNAEAFAMQLNGDGSFVLVSVKNGKQSKAAGRFTFTGGQLALAVSDGGKLVGSAVEGDAVSTAKSGPNGARSCPAACPPAAAPATAAGPRTPATPV
jgi:hypothetical protein